MSENVVKVAHWEAVYNHIFQDGFSTVLAKITSGILGTSYHAPGVFHRGTYFGEQACISIEFRYNTNKDYFLILYFVVIPFSQLYENMQRQESAVV